MNVKVCKNRKWCVKFNKQVCEFPKNTHVIVVFSWKSYNFVAKKNEYGIDAIHRCRATDAFNAEVTRSALHGDWQHGGQPCPLADGDLVGDVGHTVPAAI